jgi:ABC-2 type transport system permease protein
MIHKVYLVATREFRSVVRRRGFLIGILMVPIITTVFLLAPRFITQSAPAMEGEIAVVDPTGAIADSLPASSTLKFVKHPSPLDLPREKGWLLEHPRAGARRIGVIVLHEDDLAAAAEGSNEPGYDLYVGVALDNSEADLIHSKVREAVVEARLRAEKLEPSRIAALEQVNPPLPVLIDGGRERPGTQTFQNLLPYTLLGLLLFAAMNVGGRLLGATVEEKSNRVMEVLLSAVSPLELMAGKILGHLAVGAVIIGVYLALGSAALSSLALLGILTPWLLVCFVAFFLTSSLLLAGLMGAVGAAVNNVNDARALLWPINLMLFIPWLAAVPIARNPDSTFSVVLSFLPPMNSFVMLLRLCSTTPPPAWQVFATIGLTLGSAAGAIWMAGRVFRVALLLQGKPPDLVTLIRWARAS